jgi:hypothetical protein
VSGFAKDRREIPRLGKAARSQEATAKKSTGLLRSNDGLGCRSNSSSSNSSRICDRADMGRSMLRPYMFFAVIRFLAGIWGSCLFMEAGGGKMAAEILHMML